MLHFFCCKDILSCKNNSGGKFSSSFLQIRWQFVTAIFPVVIIAITSLKDVCLSQPTTTDARPGMATMALAMPTRAWQKFPGGKPWKLRYWWHPLTNQITGKFSKSSLREDWFSWFVSESQEKIYWSPSLAKEVKRKISINLQFQFLTWPGKAIFGHG